MLSLARVSAAIVALSALTIALMGMARGSQTLLIAGLLAAAFIFRELL